MGKGVAVCDTHFSHKGILTKMSVAKNFRFIFRFLDSCDC